MKPAPGGARAADKHVLRKRKPFTIAFLALVVGGSILGFIFNPEIRWAIGGLWFGVLLMVLSIGGLCEMMEG